jgi:formylglycine-generating enzyme required for sulfatase activity
MRPILLMFFLLWAAACADPAAERCQITRQGASGPVVRVAGDCRGQDFTDEDLSDADVSAVRWGDTTCPDGANSDFTDDGTCRDHLSPAADPTPRCAVDADCNLEGLRCLEGRCLFDCDQIQCALPAPGCDGDVALLPVAPGVCDPRRGLCDEADAFERIDCAAAGRGCVRGRCEDVYAGMVMVPAGPFLRGDASFVEFDASPPRTITLRAFWIDRTEVTVEAYNFCLQEGGCTPAMADQLDDRLNAGRLDRLDHPINGVSHDQATAFCAWAGKRLPTEAEWEKAARGVDGRLFPWGDAAPDCTRANFFFGLRHDSTDEDSGCGRNMTAPAADYGDVESPWGAIQMAGNVWEWVADWHQEDYYPQSPAEDPPGPAAGTTRVFRGGSWNTSGESLELYYRNRYTPDSRTYDIGFRCARSTP